MEISNFKTKIKDNLPGKDGGLRKMKKSTLPLKQAFIANYEQQVMEVYLQE